MGAPGSLIKIHYHDNFELLQEITEGTDDRLYYKNMPILQVSDDEHNAIMLNTKGIFVDNSYFLNQAQYNTLTLFELDKGELKFDGVTVAMKYSDTQIFNTVNPLLIPLSNCFPDLKIDEIFELNQI